MCVLKQTKSMAMYTKTLHLHSHYTAWEVMTLVGQHTQGLKKNVQVALLLCQADFTNLVKLSNFTFSLD